MGGGKISSKGPSVKVSKWSVVESQHKLAPYNMPAKGYIKGKFKSGSKEYWNDWYWNRGGRDKVQATRYIAEYKRLQREKEQKRDL